jgi:hypothetical protein
VEQLVVRSILPCLFTKKDFDITPWKGLQRFSRFRFENFEKIRAANQDHVASHWRVVRVAKNHGCVVRVASIGLVL